MIFPHFEARPSNKMMALQRVAGRVAVVAGRDATRGGPFSGPVALVSTCSQDFGDISWDLVGGLDHFFFFQIYRYI